VNGNSYTVSAPSTTSPGVRIRNTIEPSPNVSGVFTLTLDTAQGHTGSSTCTNDGPITDTATAIVSVVKNGLGAWKFVQTLSNTYSGDTIINAGVLRRLPRTADLTRALAGFP